MTINKWVLLLLVSCFLQSNCMKRKNNDTEDYNSNKKILLLDNNINNEVENEDEDNENQLIEACNSGNLDAIKSLITPKNANILDEDKNSLLMINASNTYPDYDRFNFNPYSDHQKLKVKNLIEKKENNRLQIAKYLIQQGTNINTQFLTGTALTEAIKVKNTKMINLLLEYNINFHHLDLYNAINHPDLLKILIDAGISLDYPNYLEDYYCTSAESAKMLIWNGAKVNSNIYENSDYSKSKEIHKDYINKINQKYNKFIKDFLKIIIPNNTNFPKVLISIIQDYYMESDVQYQREILVNDILFNKIGNNIQNNTKLPANISEIIANYYLRISGTDLENYCNQIS